MSSDETEPTNGLRGIAAVSWNSVLSTYLPAFILALGTGIAVPGIPTLAKSFDVSFGVASGVVTAFLLGNLFATIPSGWLVDRFGYRVIMIAGPLLTAATALIIVFTNSFAELLVLRFLGGCAAQMWTMGRLAAISQGAAPAQRGRLVSWMFGMDSCGSLAGPIVGGFIASTWGARAPFVIFAVLALIALVPASRGGVSLPSRAPAAAQVATPALSLRQLVMPRLPYFAVALFAGLTRGPLQADLLHLYAAFAYDLGPAAIGYLATGATILSLPLVFGSGWLMDRFGRKLTMVPGFAGGTIAMVALAVSAFADLSLAWYVGLFFFAVVMQALTSGSVQTVGADVAPPDARGRFLGLWRFTSQGGAALGPILFAIVADQVDYGTSFLLIAAFAAVVAVLLIRYVPETRTAD